MGEIVIIDTSILLNVLRVPGFNQDRQVVFEQFKQGIEEEATLLIPQGAVLETGNHVAQLNNGNQRRRYAKGLRDQIKKALAGEAPWNLVPLRDPEQLKNCLNEFPESAERKVGLVDLSIIKMWEAERKQHPLSRVRIWSLDDHLQGYDHQPR